MDPSSDHLILRYLHSQNISELLRWGKATPLLRDFVECELSTRHLRMLKRFSENPTRVMRLMRDTNTIISGSFAIAYFQGRSVWQSNDCDFYVPTDAYQDVVDAFIRDEGYMVGDKGVRVIEDKHMYAPITMVHTVPSGTGPGKSYTAHPVETGITAVTTLVKGNTKIDIIRSKSNSPLFPLTHFWSTAQMNFLSAEGFCCAYPDLISRRVGFLNPLVLDSEAMPRSFVLPLIRKYEKRGFRFFSRAQTFSFAEDEDFVCHGCGHSEANCPLTTRSLDDEHCLRVTFGNQGDVYGTGQRFSNLSTQDLRVSWKFGGFHGRRVQRYRGYTRTFSAQTGHTERRTDYDWTLIFSQPDEDSSSSSPTLTESDIFEVIDTGRVLDKGDGDRMGSYMAGLTLDANKPNDVGHGNHPARVFERCISPMVLMGDGARIW